MMVNFLQGKTSLLCGLVFISLAASALTSCTHMKKNALSKNTMTDNDVEIFDPFEPSNRAVMSFNAAVDKAVVFPVIKGYRKVTPEPVRSGLRNFLRNLRSPIVIVNQFLQGDAKGAGDALVRTAVNSTVGVGGIFDVAAYEGIPYESEDFGQTLGVWGVPNGPYLVVPFLGPSSLRDYTGYFTDSMADPLRIYAHNVDADGLFYAKTGVDYLDIRDSLMDSMLDLQGSSIDYYAAIRSTYYQHRKALIEDQKGTATTAIPAIPVYEDEE